MNGPGSIGLVNQFGRVQEMLLRSGQKLATGQRINAGRDDPAGLIASENLEAQLAALEAETRAMDRNDAVARTADAALAEVGDMLVEREGLEVAMANTGAMSDAERAAIQLEMDSIDQATDRMVRSAEFAGVRLFSGEVTIPSSGGDGLDLPQLTGSAGGSMTAGEIASLRGEIGSFQKNTIDARRASAQEEIVNVSAANSMIRDTDYARETANYARLRTLSDSTGAVLGMANQWNQRAASLLGLGERGPPG